ncbi:MAG: hypothetical protein KKF46_02390 [Nanoarchaeota archaeon]|nr:hypothetical protein [Nanoarchaeota archaeon]MBU1321181.1 hypothetical protein [Nanoarchaeota archaeon]MBU2441107.1 hypothetical protein [Nanoarchaeota archaeon]
MQLSEAARIFSRRIKVFFKGINKYSGDDKEICTQIIEDCYNKENNYFMVSNGHFSEFYARDFGWCTEALLNLGYRKQVLSTLDYALRIFKKYGRITQSISPNGIPFTFPNRYSPDALAFLVHSLRLAKADDLIKKYKSFLNNEIKIYFDIVIDKSSGLVRLDRHFSSMKDYSIRKSSCYDNVMTGMLANDITQLNLYNPFKKFNYKKLLMDNFWTGNYFLDDLSGNKYISGDANVFPFWSGLIKDKKIIAKALAGVRKAGLDNPFPLKYTAKRYKEQKMLAKEFFAGNYERDSIWAHMGLPYIKVVSTINKSLAKKYLDQYKKQILKHKNFLEVYDSKGEPFKTIFYYTDESMLWCANYLYLKNSFSNFS